MQDRKSIGHAAEATGLSRKMIRYYEESGLLTPVYRSDSGYRYYDQAGIEQLKFIKRARDMGFSLERIRQLMGFWHDEQRHSADVKALALQYIAELDENIARMQAMRSELCDWVDHCHGDNRPDCAIIDKLVAHPQQENT